MDITLSKILELSKCIYQSDADFEKALNVKPKTISNWKRGSSKTYYQMLPLICSLLSVSSNYLLELDDKPNKKNIQTDSNLLAEEWEIEDNVKTYLFGTVDVSDDIFNQVKQYAKFLLHENSFARIAAYGGETEDVSAPEITNSELEKLAALQKQKSEVDEIEKKLRE